MSDDNHYVCLQGLRKTFGTFAAVDDVSLDVKRGEIFALLGASGCGKSTLLRLIAGFEQADAGQILLDGQPLGTLPPYRRPVNMMFQSYALFPHMTVEQNIGYGLVQEGLGKGEIGARVAEMLRLVQMEPYAKRKPQQLSGGQQQRVALARSLAKHPKLLLLDEPMGALDKQLRGQMQLEIVNIIERLGVTCLMVTHDQEEAMTMAHRIAVMDRGQIIQVGTPAELYEQPNGRFTASFIGDVNLFEGSIAEEARDHVTLHCPALPAPIFVGHGVSGFAGMAVAYAIRPEKLRLSKTPPDQPHNRAIGEIIDIAYFGSHSVYHVRLESGQIMRAASLNAERWASERLTWNDQVWVHWDGDAGVVLVD